MKAIETKYKNHRFRSRTEARWAVWFDVLGIRWLYEEEGFALPRAGVETMTDGVQHAPTKEPVYYLPDFWLPNYKLWVEIKGKEADEEEDRKARLLAKHSGHPVLILAGSPQLRKYRHPNAPDHMFYVSMAPQDDVSVSPADLAVVFAKDPKSPEWLAAFGEATGARFEHGERPNARRIL